MINDEFDISSLNAMVIKDEDNTLFKLKKKKDEVESQCELKAIEALHNLDYLFDELEN